MQASSIVAPILQSSQLDNLPLHYTQLHGLPLAHDRLASIFDLSRVPEPRFNIIVETEPADQLSRAATPTLLI